MLSGAPQRGAKSKHQSMVEAWEPHPRSIRLHAFVNRRTRSTPERFALLRSG
jgi:hypothetical protein